MTPSSNAAPEQEARGEIDRQLEQAGWIIQNRDEVNLSAGQGVAIREFKLKSGHGYADYLLFVDAQAVGVLEAKKVGFPLGGVEIQAQKYSHGLPDQLDAPYEPLPFCYLSTGAETKFACNFDPYPRSRRIFQFHRPETLAEWLAAETVSQWTSHGQASLPRKIHPRAASTVSSPRRCAHVSRLCRPSTYQTSGRTRSKRSPTLNSRSGMIAPEP